MTTYTLSDGIQVESGNPRQGNRSGYKGAALSEAWTLDPTTPFIAACSNPKEPHLVALLQAKERTSLHLGRYSDAREAAYVIARYHSDPAAMLKYINTFGQWDSFPADLYTLLPVVLSAAQACQTMQTAAAARNASKAGAPVAKTNPATIPAPNNLYDWFTKAQLVPIVQLCGGPAAFQATIKTLTIESFAEKFNVSITQ